MKVFELVPCPPMRAKLQVGTCVGMFNSGLREECEGCELGPSRGAVTPWAKQMTVAERYRMNGFIARYGAKEEWK